jgi:hypothetical protein
LAHVLDKVNLLQSNKSITPAAPILFTSIAKCCHVMSAFATCAFNHRDVTDLNRPNNLILSIQDVQLLATLASVNL